MGNRCLDDDTLEIWCLTCRQPTIKGLWEIRGLKCPKCYPAFRGNIGLSPSKVPTPFALEYQNHFILSVGYGNRQIDEFIAVLVKYKIMYLIDLRSKPYSNYKPEFNKENIESELNKNKIHYIFMGDTIGGLPSDRSCYTDDKVDYDKIKEKDFYKEGIYRLVRAFEGRHSVAIMCSEGKPEMCHRSKLIGVTLEEQDIPVMHIDENGALVSQKDIIRKIVGDQLNLFKSVTSDLKSRGKY